MLGGLAVDPFRCLERWFDAIRQRSETRRVYELAKSCTKNAVHACIIGASCDNQGEESLR